MTDFIKKLKQKLMELFFLGLGVFIIVRPILWPDNKYLLNLRGGILLFTIAMTVIMALMIIVATVTLTKSSKLMNSSERQNVKKMSDSFQKANRTWGTVKWLIFLVGYTVVGEWWFVSLSVIQKLLSVILRQAWKEVSDKIKMMKHDDAEEAEFVEIESST